MEKSKLILKNFFGIIFVDIFFLGTELIAAYIEGKPIKIISSINISCFVILLILTIIRLIRKDYEISMYSALLLFGCSLSWVIPITGILYVISIGIGILIPVIQGKVDRRKTFWVIIEKIAITAATIMVSVLIVLGRIFRGAHGGRLMQKTMSISATGKLMWWIVFISAMILGGFSVFGMIGISQNPNSEFNQKRRRNGRKSCS